MSVMLLVIVVIVLIAVGVIIYVVFRLREPQPAQEAGQETGPSGSTLAELKCQNCGAELDEDSITVKGRATWISCPYCGSDYQLVDELP